MGRSYEQLSLDDRCEIARLSANGNAVRQIAAALDRSPSTISRELKRNRGRQVGYKPSYAQQQARARRWTGSRLNREPGLRRAVLEGLSRGWSPEQVAGRLAREYGRKVISYESIYRFIYAQIRRTTDFSWRRYLPRGKSKRGYRGRKGGSPASFIEGRVSLQKRPIEAADRSTAGHWEADLMMFSKYGQAVLTVHERTSRLLLGVRLASKVARGVARHLVRLFAGLPQNLRGSRGAGRDYDDFSAMLLFLAQRFFERVGVGLVDLVGNVLANPGAALVELQGSVLLRDLLHADQDLHKSISRRSGVRKEEAAGICEPATDLRPPTIHDPLHRPHHGVNGRDVHDVFHAASPR